VIPAIRQFLFHPSEAQVCREATVILSAMGVTFTGALLGGRAIEACWKKCDTFSEWPVSTLALAAIIAVGSSLSTTLAVNRFLITAGQFLIKQCTARPAAQIAQLSPRPPRNAHAAAGG
jgi:hypothetical protein